MLAKVLLSMVLLLGNLAWLMNPHACCPRDAGICPQVKSAVSCCCSMKQGQCSAGMDDCTDMEMPLQPILTNDSQFSKGVMVAVSDAVSDSVPLFWPQPDQVRSRIDLPDWVVPDSAVIPPHKKPPRI